MMPTPADIVRRLDSALLPLAEFRTVLSADTLATVRDSLDQRRRDAVRLVDTTGVEIIEDQIPADPRHGIDVRIYRSATAVAPAVLYCHGGAFVLGNLDTDHRQCVELSRRSGATVVSVDYRLAPENPFPAALDDVRTALDWVSSTASALGVDGDRIAVAGSSAGGALAAGLAQLSAIGQAPPLRFQLLHQPALDDRPSPAKEEFTATPGFDGLAAEQMWRHYAGGRMLPAAAVPGRLEDLAGLPPAFITCSELDPLRDEAIDYALRLLWAGVSTELQVIAGTCHGFDSMLPDWERSQQLFAAQADALARALSA